MSISRTNINPIVVTSRVLLIDASRQKLVAGYASVKTFARPSISFLNLEGINHAKKVVLMEAIVARRLITRNTIKYSLGIINYPF